MRRDKTILNEAKVLEFLEEQVPPIADVVAVTPDQDGLVAAINDILAVLRTNGLIKKPAPGGY